MNARKYQRGNAVVVALIGLVGTIAAALIAKGCGASSDSEKPTKLVPSSAPEPPAPVPTLFIRSSCHKPLRLMMAAYSQDGHRESDWFELSAGSVLEPYLDGQKIATDGGRIYYYTEDTEGNKVSYGSQIEKVMIKQTWTEKEYGMRRARLEKFGAYGHVLEVDCP